jgi:hypothetical protein
MFKVIYKTTRPNTKTLFFPPSKNIEHIVLEAKSAGQLLSDSTTFSTDRLTRTYTAVWINKEALETFKSNSLIKDFFKLRGWYEQENDHVQNTVTIETTIL